MVKASLSEPRGPFGIARSPSAHLRTFLFLLLVCLIVSVGFDVFMGGPVTGAFFRVAGPSIERAWGFAAEYRVLDGQRWLVVTSVVPGGSFDRAGIRPGNSLSQYGCLAFDFAVYRQLLEAGEATQLRVVRNPGRWLDTREAAVWVTVTRD
jgi:hypothetical protein